MSTSRNGGTTMRSMSASRNCGTSNASPSRTPSAGLWEKRERLRGEFKQALGETVDAFGAEIAALEQRLVSNNQAALASRIEVALAHERDEAQTKLAALEERLKAVPGKLPVVKTYRPDTVHYAGHVVVHRGATYQALRDTARAPPHVDDWVCVASAGRDGQSVTVRGVFAAHKKYMRFDVIEHDGSSFVAIRDNPGLPGHDGWQLVSRSGRRGPAGEVGPRGKKGERGARGEDGREIVSWHLERKTYRAFPVYQDGRMG